MTRPSKSLRDSIVTLAHGCCEYCQSQQIVVLDMELDHIQPESAGGKTTLENLFLSCLRCNRYKRNRVTGIDPDTGDEVALYNPRTQIWADHFKWSADQATLIGLTATGRATISRLKINDDNRVAARRLWVAGGLHPPKD